MFILSARQIGHSLAISEYKALISEIQRMY